MSEEEDKRMFPFKVRLTPDQRRRQYDKAMRLKPDHVPVILEPGSRATPLMTRDRFLLPPDLTMSQLAFVVRRRVDLQPTQSLFLVCKRRMVTGTTQIDELYRAHRDPEDGFLYMNYALEETFGA